MGHPCIGATIASRITKMHCTGRVSLLGLMLLASSVGGSNAARETLSVTDGGVTFTIARYDDDRNKPYRLKFKQDGTRSLYMFDSAAHVTNLKVGEDERYQVRRTVVVLLSHRRKKWIFTERACIH